MNAEPVVTTHPALDAILAIGIAATLPPVDDRPARRCTRYLARVGHASLGDVERRVIRWLVVHFGATPADAYGIVLQLRSGNLPPLTLYEVADAMRSGREQEIAQAVRRCA